MQTYVSTIGHHSTRVMRPVLNNGIDGEDAIILLRPHSDSSEQGEDAVRDVRQTVRELGPGADVLVEEISYESFETSVLECMDILEAAEGTLIVNFDGGPREIFLPFVVATLSRPALIDRVFQFRDIDGQVCELSLPDIVHRVPPTTDQTLQAVADLGPKTTLPQIAEQTGKARSTVGRHLDKLEEVGAVRTNKDKKIREVELTLGGQIRC